VRGYEPADLRVSAFEKSFSMKKRIVWVPWIKEQGDVLIDEVLGSAKNLEAVPLRFHAACDEDKRRSLLDFAVQCPTAFARLFERRLMELDGPLHAMVLTLDWIGPMKVAAAVAAHHGLPVVILPHEGVFIEPDRFYTNPYGGTNVPSGDIFLAWGGFQMEQMEERGYPKNRIVCVSSPKLQAARLYRPKMSKRDYASRFGFKENKPIVLFAAQNLDNCGDPDAARIRQADALEDVAAVCSQNDFELIVRLPPANISPIFLNEIARRFPGTPHFAITKFEEGRIELEPREAMIHADCVVSISSTMLLEKGLMDGPTLVLDYIGTRSNFVTRGKCPAVSSRGDMQKQLPALVASGKRSFTKAGWRQMEKDFSSGSFEDSDAAQRITDILDSLNFSHFLDGRPALFSGFLRPSGIALGLFHLFRKLPRGRTIARKLFAAIS
jgi:hypothetical protein